MRLLALTLMCVAGSATVARGQQDPQWQAGVSTFVSEGNYGTPDRTRLVYTSVSLRRLFPRGDLTVRMPWLDIRSEGTVVVFQGTPQPAPTRRDARAAPTTVRVRQTTREAGVGDVGIVGRYFLVENQGARPGVDVTLRLELPTGDEARGLGLGAATAEIGVELLQALGPRFVALAAASFTSTGRPADVDVQNPWEYSVGAGVYPRPSILLSLSYEQWQPVIPGSPVGRDLLAGATFAAGRYFRILASAQLPLSEQAPDFGAGAGLAVRF